MDFKEEKSKPNKPQILSSSSLEWTSPSYSATTLNKDKTIVIIWNVWYTPNMTCVLILNSCHMTNSKSSTLSNFIKIHYWRTKKCNFKKFLTKLWKKLVHWSTHDWFCYIWMIKNRKWDNVCEAVCGKINDVKLPLVGAIMKQLVG